MKKIASLCVIIFIVVTLMLALIGNFLNYSDTKKDQEITKKTQGPKEIKVTKKLNGAILFCKSFESYGLPLKREWDKDVYRPRYYCESEEKYIGEVADGLEGLSKKPNTFNFIAKGINETKIDEIIFNLKINNTKEKEIAANELAETVFYALNSYKNLKISDKQKADIKNLRTIKLSIDGVEIEAKEYYPFEVTNDAYFVHIRSAELLAREIKKSDDFNICKNLISEKFKLPISYLSGDLQTPLLKADNSYSFPLSSIRGDNFFCAVLNDGGYAIKSSLYGNLPYIQHEPIYLNKK